MDHYTRKAIKEFLLILFAVAFVTAALCFIIIHTEEHYAAAKCPNPDSVAVRSLTEGVVCVPRFKE